MENIANDVFNPAGLLTVAPKLPDTLWIRIMSHGGIKRLDVFDVKPEMPPENMGMNAKLMEISINE